MISSVAINIKSEISWWMYTTIHDQDGNKIPFVREMELKINASVSKMPTATLICFNVNEKPLGGPEILEIEPGEIIFKDIPIHSLKVT